MPDPTALRHRLRSPSPSWRPPASVPMGPRSVCTVGGGFDWQQESERLAQIVELGDALALVERFRSDALSLRRLVDGLSVLWGPTMPPAWSDQFDNLWEDLDLTLALAWELTTTPLPSYGDPNVRLTVDEIAAKIRRALHSIDHELERDAVVLAVLRSRDGISTTVRLRDGRSLTVLDIAYGYDAGDTSAHITTNCSPGRAAAEVGFFFTRDVQAIEDPLQPARDLIAGA